MDLQEFIELAEKMFNTRNLTAVPRQHIAEAVNRINQGKERVRCNYFGAPLVPDVHAVASRLYREATPAA